MKQIPLYWCLSTNGWLILSEKILRWITSKSTIKKSRLKTFQSCCIGDKSLESFIFQYAQTNHWLWAFFSFACLFFSIKLLRSNLFTVRIPRYRYEISVWPWPIKKVSHWKRQKKIAKQELLVVHQSVNSFESIESMQLKRNNFDARQ